MDIRLIAASLAALCGACASLPAAQMALPATLSRSVNAYTIEGIGGGERGEFRVGPYSGSFRRSETRLAFFDPLIERRNGSTRFSVSGGEFEGAIEASCSMRERALTLSVISVPTRPMAYWCEFTHQGRPIPARFELQEVQEGLGSALNQRRRAGEIAFDHEVLRIRSTHALQGSPIQMASPIGYVFEQNGAVIAAVEVNGAPVLMLADGANPAQRRAALMGALALGLFWDPANSSLGE